MSSQVWKYFKIDAADNRFAKCNICSKLISRGGGSKSTSNLMKHFKTHSKSRPNAPTNREPAKTLSIPSGSTLSNYFSKNTNLGRKTSSPDMGLNVEEISDDNLSLSVDVSDTDDPNPLMTSPNLSAVSPASTTDLGDSSEIHTSPRFSPYPKAIHLRNQMTLQQQTLPSMYDKIKKFKSDDIRSKNIDKLIAEMVCLDFQPFSVVENKGFRRLINNLEPRYTIPSRKTLTNKIISDMYQNLIREVKEELSQATNIALTTDMWTSVSNTDYMAVTAHFYSNDGNAFTLTHKCLEVIPFEEVSHSAENLKNFLVNVLQEWGILEKVVGILRDNGPNITAALARTSFEAIPCIAHTLQLVIKDSLFQNQKIMNVVSKSKKIVGSFKHSAKNTKMLLSCQKQLKLPEHRMIQDEPTRWNSTLHMMKRLLEQKDAIVLVSNKPDVKLAAELTCDDWKTMEFAINILDIFEKATLQVSKSSSCISEVSF